MPDDLLPDYVKVEGEAAKQGVTYLSADGSEIFNLGQKQIRYKTSEQHDILAQFQIADVRRALLSVPALTASGHEVVFEKRGGTIAHPEGKRTIKFRRQGGIYVLDMYVAPFQRQG